MRVKTLGSFLKESTFLEILQYFGFNNLEMWLVYFARVTSFFAGDFYHRIFFF